jgi:hypothetical protein
VEESVTKQDLTLVGLSQDKAKLLLVSDDGTEFTLAADSRLRAALRGDSARLGQLEIQMESALRPRDIQSRIRAGESPEDVATAAQTSLDKIMGFATPVLAERAHVAERAQRASVRRGAADGPAGALGETVAERLRSRGVEPASVEWDAWRREDGRWTLTASYLSGESARSAEFAYDAAGRYVVAEDDESRWLVGERSARHGPQPRAGAPVSGQRRLSSVHTGDELPLGEDAIDLVSDPPEAGGEDLTEDLTEDLGRDLSGALSEPEVHVGAGGADADWMLTQASERRGPAATGAAEDQSEQAPQRPARKGRRPSVPSWDEIMFGSGRD